MIWGIKDNQRIKATPKQKAFCPLCKEELIAKCGEIKIWHFAHKSGNECDAFFEPESEWHINWKNEFPVTQQEVMIKKGIKYHIADIKTKTGKVIELQHSPISKKDVEKREEFYDDMIWLLDGKTFGKNIQFKSKVAKWKWMPSIIKYTKNDIFVDIGNKSEYFINIYEEYEQKIKNKQILIEKEGNKKGWSSEEILRYLHYDDEIYEWSIQKDLCWKKSIEEYHKIIKINSYWKFRGRTYIKFTKYSKEQFLQIYGDIIK